MKVLEFIEKRINYVFILFLFGLVFLYNIQDTSFMRPQGLHQWRQSVGAAYAKNYYNYDLNILETRIYNNLSKNAESDRVLAEFPIFYYGIAILYKIFGPHESIFRIVNLLMLFLGLFYLMKALILLLDDRFWALLISISAFSSATLVYYSNSFLPDTTAYGLTYIALYHIVKFSKNKKLKHVYIASVIYIFAGLIKASALMPLLAFIGTYVLMFIFSAHFRNEYKYYKFIIPSILPILFTVLWYIFMNYYHSIHGGSISLLHIRAYWMLEPEMIASIWDRILNLWLDTYYHRYFLIIALVLFVLSFFMINRNNAFSILFLLISLMGSAGFFFLYFRSLKVHDYYLINTFYLVPLALALGIYNIKKLYNKPYLNWVLIFIFVLFLRFLFLEAKTDIGEKLNNYNGWQKKYFYSLADIEPKLEELGIRTFDKVIISPDPSINISLNMVNRPGYTDFGFVNKKAEDRINYFIEHGARYLFILDREHYAKEENAYIKEFMDKKVFSYENLDIYDLSIYVKQE
jgi:hypothetical protein